MEQQWWGYGNGGWRKKNHGNPADAQIGQSKVIRQKTPALTRCSIPIPCLFSIGHGFPFDGTTCTALPCCCQERQRRSKSIRLGAAAAAWRQRQEGGGRLRSFPAAADLAPESDDSLPVLLYVAAFRKGGSSDELGGGWRGEAGWWWEAGWSPCLEGAWSEYYKGNERRPWDTELAPWVAPRFERRLARLAAMGEGGRGGFGGTPPGGSGSDTEAE